MDPAKTNPLEVAHEICFYHLFIYRVCFKYTFMELIYIYRCKNTTLGIISHVHHTHSSFIKIVFEKVLFSHNCLMYIRDSYAFCCAISVLQDYVLV